MRSASPGEIEQVHALGVIEVPRTCDRVQDVVRGSGEVTAFQLGVVVEADAGPDGYRAMADREAIKVMVTP